MVWLCRFRREHDARSPGLANVPHSSKRTVLTLLLFLLATYEGVEVLWEQPHVAIPTFSGVQTDV
eukprot:11065399-Lingulodinium_polyedra.AAC.1